jgi:hypothetical protein
MNAPLPPNARWRGLNCQGLTLMIGGILARFGEGKPLKGLLQTFGVIVKLAVFLGREYLDLHTWRGETPKGVTTNVCSDSKAGCDPGVKTQGDLRWGFGRLRGIKKLRG